MRKNSVVVVTGASAGLGRAIAEAFASEGARVALLARNHERLEDVKREVEKRGGQALVIPTDVSIPEQVTYAAEQVVETFGTIDVWINNAMVSVFSPVKDLKPEEVKRVTDVSYLGYVYGTLAALHVMLPKDEGVIIQVSSALAHRSIPLQAAYCGAKHAIEGFTESLRSELLHDQSKVRITAVNMPALNTPQFEWSKSRMPHKAQPVPPIFQPEVGANAVVWASKHDRRELNVGLSTSIARNGNKVAPLFADYYLAKTGYGSQQTEERAREDRPNNLWHSVPGNFGSHGRFDAEASSFSPYLWLSERRSWLLGLGVGAGALYLARKQMRNGKDRLVS